MISRNTMSDVFCEGSRRKGKSVTAKRGLVEAKWMRWEGPLWEKANLGASREEGKK